MKLWGSGDMLATHPNQMVWKITMTRSTNNPTCKREMKDRNQNKAGKNWDLLVRSQDRQKDYLGHFK